MITTLKLAGLSAILSAGLVGPWTGPDQAGPAAGGKVFVERLGGDVGRAALHAADTGRDLSRRFMVNAARKSDRLHRSL